MTAGNDLRDANASLRPPEVLGLVDNDELQVQLLACLTRVHRFQFAVSQAFSKSAPDSDDLNEILSAALSLEEAIAKMYAASGVAPSRSAAGV